MYNSLFVVWKGRTEFNLALEEKSFVRMSNSCMLAWSYLHMNILSYAL